MNKGFSSMRVRALCHATESIEKVKKAVLLIVPEAELEISKAAGHHGNAIEIIEAKVKDEGIMSALFSRLSHSDLEDLQRTLDSRIDESCNFFLRADKQEAFRGSVRLTSGEDSISVKVKVRAFPARRDSAITIVREHIEGCLEKPREAEAVGQ